MTSGCANRAAHRPCAREDSGNGEGRPNPPDYRSPRAESSKAYLGSVTLTAPESWGAMAGSALYAGVIEGFGSLVQDQSNVYVGATVNTPLKGLKVGASYDQVGHLPGVGDIAAFDLYASFQASDKLTISTRAEYAKGNNLGAALGTESRADGAAIRSDGRKKSGIQEADLFGVGRVRLGCEQSIRSQACPGGQRTGRSLEDGRARNRLSVTFPVWLKLGDFLPLREF